MTIRREDLDAGRIGFTGAVTGEIIPPVTPGAVLREEFLAPMGLSATRLAEEIGVPTNRITAIINGTRAVTAETAILLGQRLGTTPQFWMGLQTAFDLEQAKVQMTPPPKVRLTRNPVTGKMAFTIREKIRSALKPAASGYAGNVGKIAEKVLSGKPATTKEQRVLARSILAVDHRSQDRNPSAGGRSAVVSKSIASASARKGK